MPWSQPDVRVFVGQLLRFLRFDMDVTLFYFDVLSNTNTELFDMSNNLLRAPACQKKRAPPCIRRKHFFLRNPSQTTRREVHFRL